MRAFGHDAAPRRAAVRAHGSGADQPPQGLRRSLLGVAERRRNQLAAQLPGRLVSFTI